MKHYKNLSGNSGIISYEAGGDYIKIRFVNKAEPYIYSDSKVGKHHVDQMKKLASEGRGLSAYINRHPEVKNKSTLSFQKGKTIKGKFPKPGS